MASKGRKQRAVRELHRVLILCEDEKSSRFYLESFPYNRHTVQIECIGTGWNTDSLMEKARDMKLKAETSRRPYNQVWVVFDRDSFPEPNWNRAFSIAKGNNIYACWSNPCFELWYLLHFEYRHTSVSRNNLPKILSDKIPNGYEKNDPKIYNKMKHLTSTALANGRKLEVQNGHLNKARNCNPSTFVHHLVKKLRDLQEAM